MTLPTRPEPRRLSRAGAFLREELAPRPGRLDSVWRYLVVSAIVLTLSLALQIPMLGLSLMIVFFTAQDNLTLTLATCVFSVLGTTFAIAVTLLLVKFTMGYPLFRLLGAALVLFSAIYFMRISKLGQLGWLTALVACYAMTLLDVVDNPEYLTRFLLWVWVAVAYPILATALVNLLLLPAHPVRQPQEMAHALNALAEAGTLPDPGESQAREGLISADWLANPVYAQFALKTLAAATICYGFQAAVQWPGIHTAPLTCIIVALPSLGASARKGLQRAIGCAAGSLVTLAITVFLIPHMETLPSLLLLTLPIIAIGAWIAAGSVRSSYVGVQFVFAFALALFGHFGPDSNIPGIRDRLVGILLGVAVSAAVHLLLWPEREGSELWSQLARLLRSIAGLARAGDGREGAAANLAEVGKARQACWRLLAANREMESRVALEPGWQYPHGAVTVDLQTWFAQVQEVLFAINGLQTVLQHARPELPKPLLGACEAFRAEAARWLEQLAEQWEHPGGDQTPVSLEGASAEMERQCGLARGSAPGQGRIEELAAATRAVRERISQLSQHLCNPVRFPEEAPCA